MTVFYFEPGRDPRYPLSARFPLEPIAEPTLGDRERFAQAVGYDSWRDLTQGMELSERRDPKDGHEWWEAADFTTPGAPGVLWLGAIGPVEYLN